MPPEIEGRGPTLATLHEIERILRRAEFAISVNEIKRRMNAKAVRHDAVRMALDEFKRLGFVIEGSKGVLWTYNPDSKLLAASTPL
ncbi:MAG: hypothetical protein AABX89_01440 [Candidatus Thermoplasmatota archaeon]